MVQQVFRRAKGVSDMTSYGCIPFIVGLNNQLLKISVQKINQKVVLQQKVLPGTAFTKGNSITTRLKPVPEIVDKLLYRIRSLSITSIS